MIQQFQDQVEEAYSGSTDLSKVAAKDWFQYLPPAGMLPVRATNSPKGFDVETFFAGQSPKAIATMDGAALRALFAEALYHEPIAVGGSKVQLYVTFENLLAVEAGVGSQLAVIFASEHLLRRERARFSFASFAAGRYATHYVR